MQRDDYYNPMPQQNNMWQFNPDPVDYATQRQMGQGAIDAQQRNQAHLDNLYSWKGLGETLPQVPGFMSEMVPQGMSNMRNLWDAWNTPQPLDAIAKASPWGQGKQDFGWR